MEPLAPLVDRMRALATEELPAPRTCKIRLWDDGTFDVVIYHGSGFDTSVRQESSSGNMSAALAGCQNP